jgi:NAD(P)-dependent dehydrogenase (short-subunit alcohol dehydrogenase family)
VNDLDFSGKVVVITGGTRGIGRAMCAAFADRGALVLTCGRTTPGVAVPRGATFEAVDVRDAEQVNAFIDGVVTTHGRLDVAVANAGGAPYNDAASASPRFHQSIIALNLTAGLHLAQAANRVMQLQPEGGSIVLVSSVSGMRPSPGTAAYGAAKAGLISLAGSLAVEWAPRVRVNCLTGGPVETELSDLHYGDAAGVAAVGATIPMGHLATPSEIADVCLFLASPLARYVTGSNIVVHGGGERPAFLGASTAQFGPSR